MPRDRHPALVVVAPIAIAELNCEAATGRPWRWVSDLARANRIPRLPGKMPCFSAVALSALFTTDGERVGAALDEETVTPDQILAAVGRRRVAGSR